MRHLFKERNMIRNTSYKVLFGGLGVALVGVTLAGCGQNNTGETTTAQAPAPDAQTGATVQTETAATTGAVKADDHDAEIRATLGKFFPGAELAAKPFPFDDNSAAHMGEEAGVKFTGKEKDWQVFEATANGKRVGLGVMTHSALPDGKDMHIAFGVNPQFAISHVTALDAPNNDKAQTFVRQMVGKNHDAAFKVGKDLKAVSGLSPQVAQIAADAVHKGIFILEENFNPLHSEHEHSGHDHSGGAGHTEGDGHTH
jgi:hypothetical protein